LERVKGIEPHEADAKANQEAFSLPRPLPLERQRQFVLATAI